MHRNGLRFCLIVSIVAGFGEGRRAKDELRFHVEPDARLTRSVQITNDLALASVSMTIDGQEVEDLASDVGLRVHREDSYVVLDVFEAVAEGQPRKLRRTFKELSSNGTVASPEDGGSPPAEKYESGLAGHEVVFTWDEEKHESVAAFAEGETGEEYLLRGLEEDMDLRALLPAGEVKVGDEWDVDIAEFAKVNAPGGNLGIKPKAEKGEEGMGMMPGMDNFGDMASMLGDTFDGEAKGEYKGTREVDGVTVGVIHLTVKMKSSNDMSELVKKAVPELPEGVGKLDIDHVDVDADIEGEGTLLWNLAAGHVQSLELSGKMKMAMETGLSISAQGRDMNMEQSMSMSGTISNTLSVTKN